MADVRSGGHTLLQIMIIVSDGHIVEDREEVIALQCTHTPCLP